MVIQSKEKPTGREPAPASMLRGFVLFGDDFTDVRLVAVIASAWNPGPALAAKLCIQSAIGMVSTNPSYAKTNGAVFIHVKRLLFIVARGFLIGSVFVQGFLQFPLCLQIELLVSALWLTRLLPKFIRAADDIHSGRPCHDRPSLFCFRMAPSHDPGLGDIRGAFRTEAVQATIVMARKTNSNS